MKWARALKTHRGLMKPVIWSYFIIIFSLSDRICGAQDAAGWTLINRLESLNVGQKKLAPDWKHTWMQQLLDEPSDVMYISGVCNK